MKKCYTCQHRWWCYTNRIGTCYANILSYQVTNKRQAYTLVRRIEKVGYSNMNMGMLADLIEIKLSAVADDYLFFGITKMLAAHPHEKINEALRSKRSLWVRLKTIRNAHINDVLPPPDALNGHSNYRKPTTELGKKIEGILSRQDVWRL